MPTFTRRVNTEHGIFINADMWREYKVADIPYLKFWTKAIFFIEMDVRRPLIFKRPDGVWFKTRGTFYSDHGSIPLTVQPGLPKDRFLLSFLIHDSACIDHGLYVSRDKGITWTFEWMPSGDVHILLGVMVRAEDATRLQFALVFRAVWRFGPKWTAEDSAAEEAEQAKKGGTLPPKG